MHVSAQGSGHGAILPALGSTACVYPNLAEHHVFFLSLSDFVWRAGIVNRMLFCDFRVDTIYSRFTI